MLYNPVASSSFNNVNIAALSVMVSPPALLIRWHYIYLAFHNSDGSVGGFANACREFLKWEVERQAA